MRRVILTVAVFGVAAVVASMCQRAIFAANVTDDTAARVDAQIVPAADRVVVMYFHRTKRCPTCLKMGSYTEEAVKKGFAQEIKEGKVEFHFIDFQDPKNAALTKGYQVSGPTLIVAKVVDNKVKDRKNLKEMWTKVGDKAAFIEYVKSNVRKGQTSGFSDEQAL
jgi:thiol-disulfide isomerase/thioredoxin